jgi:hypothetical protein
MRSGNASGNTGSGGGGGGGVSGGNRNPISSVSSGLAGFGSFIRSGGLQAALDRIGVEDLRGRPAAEIIATIAQHLADGISGTQNEIVSDALRNAIFDAAAMQGDPQFEQLEISLQDYLTREGVEGLIELFLSHYAFEQLWLLIENHVDLKSADDSSRNAMASAVENSCRSNVHDLVQDLRQNGTFDTIDWFSNEGLAVCDNMISDLEERLRTL